MKARLSIVPVSRKALDHLAWATSPIIPSAPAGLWPHHTVPPQGLCTCGSLCLQYSSTMKDLQALTRVSAQCHLCSVKEAFLPMPPSLLSLPSSYVILSWQKLLFCLLILCLNKWTLSRDLPAWSSSPGSMHGTYVRQGSICGINEWMNIHYVYIFAKKWKKKWLNPGWWVTDRIKKEEYIFTLAKSLSGHPVKGSVKNTGPYRFTTSLTKLFTPGQVIFIPLGWKSHGDKQMENPGDVFEAEDSLYF